MIDRALFLRCLCAENNLHFDATGKPEGTAKTVDWTLAAVTVQKVRRESATTIELDGVRVAIRYAADRHEFERHPQKEEAVHLHLETPVSAEAFTTVLQAVFAQGLDHAFVDRLPDFWQHYFRPQLAWTASQQVAPPIYELKDAAGTQDSVAPAVRHEAQPGYTPEAAADHVQGAVVLHMVVDATGATHQVSIQQPLGYGLDGRAAESAQAMRFQAGTRGGQPVAYSVQFRQEFVLVQVPH
jgi:TonB family protein